MAVKRPFLWFLTVVPLVESVSKKAVHDKKVFWVDGWGKKKKIEKGRYSYVGQY